MSGNDVFQFPVESLKAYMQLATIPILRQPLWKHVERKTLSAPRVTLWADGSCRSALESLVNEHNHGVCFVTKRHWEISAWEASLLLPPVALKTTEAPSAAPHRAGQEPVALRTTEAPSAAPHRAQQEQNRNPREGADMGDIPLGFLKIWGWTLNRARSALISASQSSRETHLSNNLTLLFTLSLQGTGKSLVNFNY